MTVDDRVFPVLSQLFEAVQARDAARVRSLAAEHSALRAVIDDPIGPFDSPVVMHASTPDVLDALLDAGVDINARSRWWAGGFGLLDLAAPPLAAYAIARGASITAHAAARLGLSDTLREMLAGDSGLVNARGGDGQTPLHCASTVEIAEQLIAAGASLDARDVDHESTPAQYMIRERQDVARYLVDRGCVTDLLMTAALGDVNRTRTHLDADPVCIRMRVDEESFPKTNPRAGGTIYNWTLGFYQSAHGVAKSFGHAEVLALLFERTPPRRRVLEACWIGDEAAARSYRAALIAGDRFLNEEQTLIAHAARNNMTATVRLMLEAGVPPDARGQHEATPLHWAAFHGNADMIREILTFDPPLEATDGAFHATPLGWAMHGSRHGWYRDTGDYESSVERLLAAGAQNPSAA